MVPGIITAASRPKHKATYITIQCRQCGWVTGEGKCVVGRGVVAQEAVGEWNHANT